MEEESSLQASDESPSLISALNVERALRGIRNVIHPNLSAYLVSQVCLIVSLTLFW